MLLLTLALVAATAVSSPLEGQVNIARRAPSKAATTAPHPIITPAPQISGRVYPRDSIETVTVSDCYHVVAANTQGCSCDNIDTMLPMLSVNGSVAPGSVLCDYSTVVQLSTTMNPFPYTTTAPNCQIVAFATSTTLKDGKQLSMELNPSASQNVGTLTGQALYTSISSALVAGCGTVAAGATLNTCSSIPQITGIGYVENDGALQTYFDDGTLDLSIPFMSVSDNNVLTALINSIAGAYSASSVSPNNTVAKPANCEESIFGEQGPCAGMQNVTTISALAQAIYTDATDSGIASPQNLGVAVTFGQAEGNEYLCDAASLASAAIYYSANVLEALALIPGFEWAAALGTFVGAADATTKATIKAISLTCELEKLTGSE